LKIVLLEQSCFEGYHRVILFLFFSKLKTIVGMGFFGSRRIIEITEVQSVAMLGFHKLCCHVGISQIMLPCWDFTNYVAMFWSSQILFLVTKRKGKDVPV
jgi:hypothetical protein